MTNKFFLLFLLISVPLFMGFSQSFVEDIPDTVSLTPSIDTPQDSLLLNINSIPNDSIPNDNIIAPEPVKSSSQIDSQIIYSAQDSIVFWSNGTGFLHGNGDVKYKEITLDADYIRIKMDSSLIYARGTVDSIGDIIGEPIFGDGSAEYNSKEITYNLQTGKGYVSSAVTQQGEGYIVSERTKKTGDDLLTVGGAKYTTCDDHDHPHFYLHITEGKVKPGSYIVAGKSQLVLADVPLPISLPFAFFPFSNQYSSGLMMPSITDDFNRGFGLVNGGYYFAVSDYIDLELLGEIYTKGTWGISAVSKYIKRYKYTGNFNFSYREDVTGEKDMPDYEKRKSMSIIWTHSQDVKANPYRTLSANVNFSSSGYDRNNINNYYNPEITSQNTKASSINFTQRFPRIPLLNISGGVSISQRTQDSTLTLNLPNLSISYSRFYPLKRKNAVGKERWYEKISMSYSGNLQNSITTKEDQLFSSSFSRDWKNGMRHSIPIQASFTAFNYLTITPYFNYNERWNLSSIRKNYDATIQGVVIDTISGFHRNYDFNTGISMQTKLYGYYIPIRSIFGDKVDRIRHVFTPSIDFKYSPDFGDSRWGFWDEYLETDIYGNMTPRPYSIYEGIGMGGPSRGKTGNINFSLNNNVEMKIRNDRDTTGTEAFRKISLIDQFSISGGYNLMADSLNWSLFSATLRLKLGKNKTLSLNGSFDPYLYDFGSDSIPHRVNELSWKHGKFPTFLGTSSSYTMSFNNGTIQNIINWLNGSGSGLGSTGGEEPYFNAMEFNTDFTEDTSNEDSEEDRRRTKKKKRAVLDDDGYEEIKIPWNINITYSASFNRPTNGREHFDYEKKRYKMQFRHNLNISGNVSLTDNWRINASMYIDLKEKKVTQTNFNVTRNLHCWTMTATIVPFGFYKSYHFRIGVNASMLKDLKWEKRNNQTAVNWY